MPNLRDGAAIGVQHVEMAKVPFRPWPHWNNLAANSHEFKDPGGDRIVRIVWCERLEPLAPTAIASLNVPEHLNSYDVVLASFEFAPAARHGSGPELIGGLASVRPEGLLSPAMEPMPTRPPSPNIVVNLAIHTEGPSGEPLVTIDEIAAILPQLERERPGSVLSARGEYRGEDGTLHELLEVCWERKMGRPFPYPAEMRIAAPLVMPVNAVPWYDTTVAGVSVKPLARLANAGPNISLIRLAAGSGFSDSSDDLHRTIVVVGGAVSRDGQAVDTLGALYAPPGIALGRIATGEGAVLLSLTYARTDAPLTRAWNGEIAPDI